MKDMELRDRRDRDLYEAYLEGLREKSPQDRREAVEYARNHPAPRFYISGDYCRLIMGKRLAGEQVRLRNGISARKFDRLWELFNEEMAKGNITIEEACHRIVEKPAPSFFLRWETAEKIIRKERKKACERLLKRYSR